MHVFTCMQPKERRAAKDPSTMQTYSALTNQQKKDFMLKWQDDPEWRAGCECLMGMCGLVLLIN